MPGISWMSHSWTVFLCAAYHGQSAKIEVQTDTIDHFCGERGIDSIDILKVDVEGGRRPSIHRCE